MVAQNIAISIFSATAGTQLNVLLQQCVITRVSNNHALPKGYYHMVVIAVQDCNTSYRRIISIKFCQTFSILEFLNRRKHDIITLSHLHSSVPIISLHSHVRALKCWSVVLDAIPVDLGVQWSVWFTDYLEWQGQNTLDDPLVPWRYHHLDTLLFSNPFPRSRL